MVWFSKIFNFNIDKAVNDFVTDAIVKGVLVVIPSPKTFWCIIFVELAMTIPNFHLF